MELEQNFRDQISDIGPPDHGKPVTKEQIAYFVRHFPQSYIDFVLKYGLGSYFDRGIQFIDPEEYRPLMALILKADPDMSHENCHLVSYTAFGQLMCWSEKYWAISINLLQYEIWNSRLFPSEFGHTKILPSPKIKPSANSIAWSVLPDEEDDRELWDIWNDPMFDRCVAQNGALDAGECFGFFPSLGMTGYNSRSRVVENTKRVKALEHFCMIAQMQDFRLTRIGPRGKKEYLRVVG